MNVLLKKFREVITAISPIVILVIILHFAGIAPLPGTLLFQFILDALAIILGLSILLFGIEVGVLPFGEHLGASFIKSNKMWYVIAVGIILGFFINIAEPDLQVLATQVSEVMGGYIPSGIILVAVSLGTGVMLALGIRRIVRRFPLNVFFIIIFGITGVLALYSSPDMLAIGFDASGATTGALTVPLVLALSAGAAAMKKDNLSAEEDSFGLVGIMSTGAPLGILILNMFIKTDNIVGVLEIHEADTGSLLGPFLAHLPLAAADSFIALLPVFLLLIIFQVVQFRLRYKAFARMLRGLILTYIGLVIFLASVNAGFMDVGNIIGHSLAGYENKAILVSLGFLLGMLVILTEPAVYILTHQIENITNGYIKRRMVLATLSIGVAFAIGLSMLRIVIPELQLWHYILPGFAIALAMSFFVPRVFVGIAFDSGAVASGPMTATFVLAFAQGASDAIEYSNMLTDSFGVIAMVAMTPLITLQVLGLFYKIKSRKSGV
ncbi:MAG: DUF1538 domain-containing protein [Spirochaetota bacterium]|nr:DUF1538 domain-containing protein [Spirochaetota bacterium]